MWTDISNGADDDDNTVGSSAVLSCSHKYRAMDDIQSLPVLWLIYPHRLYLSCALWIYNISKSFMFYPATCTRWQEDLNSIAFGQLEETTRMPSYYVDEDLTSKTWNLTTSPWMKQLTWLRIVHSGDWCLRLVLRTSSGACHRRRRRRPVPGREPTFHLVTSTVQDQHALLSSCIRQPCSICCVQWDSDRRQCLL